MPTRQRWTVLVLVLGLCLAACGLLPGTSGRDAVLRAVADHRAQWLAQGIDSYTFTVRRSCFCPFGDPVDVTVTAGIPVDVRSDGDPVDPARLGGLPLTIIAAFELIESQADADSLTLEWDPALGYPTRIDADPIANAVDDEFQVEVSALRPAS